MVLVISNHDSIFILSTFRFASMLSKASPLQLFPRSLSCCPDTLVSSTLKS